MKNRIYKKPYKPSYTVTNARILRRNSTQAEEKLWQILRNRKFMGLKFRRQVTFGRYVLDFYCKAQKLVVEIDGDYHSTVVEYDVKREELLDSAGLRILRFSNQEILKDIEKVLQILEEIIR